MSSEKEQARLKRIEATKALQKKQKRTRLLVIAAGAVGLIVLAVIVAVIATSGKGTGDASNIVGTEETSAMFQGVAQEGLIAGSKDAPVTLVEYVDPQCPYCAMFSTQVLPNIYKDYVKSGKVKVESKPIAFLGPDSNRGAYALVEAAKQGKGPQFLETFYKNQGKENSGYVTDDFLTAVAKSAGVAEPAKIVEAATGHQEEVEAIGANLQAFTDAGFRGTPSWQLIDAKGKTKSFTSQEVNPTDNAAFVKLIDEALAK